MTRTAPVILSVSAFCLMAGASGPAAADDGIPDYFFKEWTISRDCTAPRGPRGHTRDGLKLRVTRDVVSEDGQTYTLEAIDANGEVITSEWNGVDLQYRPGQKMDRIPASFECVPGQEHTHPILSMSGYSQLSEPWYEYEHWYGLVELHGELHHALIFPRDARGPASAVIVLHDVTSADDIQLDHNGTIIVES